MKFSTSISCMILGLLVSTTLVSCASGDDFDKAESIPLPAEGVEAFGPPIDDSVKLLGADGAGHTFYIGQWEEKYGSSYCLVMDSGEGFERACGGTLPISATFSLVRAVVDPIASQREISSAQELVGDYLIVEQR